MRIAKTDKCLCLPGCTCHVEAYLNLNLEDLCPAPLQVYCPYLLISKKRYAGLLYTQPDKHDKMDSKVQNSKAQSQRASAKKILTTSCSECPWKPATSVLHCCSPV